MKLIKLKATTNQSNPHNLMDLFEFLNSCVENEIMDFNITSATFNEKNDVFYLEVELEQAMDVRGVIVGFNLDRTYNPNFQFELNQTVDVVHNFEFQITVEDSLTNNHTIKRHENIKDRLNLMIRFDNIVSWEEQFFPCSQYELNKKQYIDYNFQIKTSQSWEVFRNIFTAFLKNSEYKYKMELT